MPFLIKLDTTEYPISITDFKSRFPDKSFPSDLSKIDFESYGYSLVQSTPFPEANQYQAIAESPPVLVNGKYEQVWTVIDNHNLETLKDLMKQQCTYKRREVESGGLTLANGVKVMTAKDDQDRIASAILFLRDKPAGTEIDWKADSGWVKLKLEDIEAIKDTIGTFVQQCFTSEKNHHVAIDALSSISECYGYDINSNWPG